MTPSSGAGDINTGIRSIITDETLTKYKCMGTSFLFLLINKVNQY